jgi:hypothetical protein
MDCFSFTAEITDERTLMLPTGSAIGRGPVAITPAGAGLSKDKIEAGLENERDSWR